MLICKLESLDKPNSFFNIPSNCIIINLDRSNLMVLIKDKHSSQRCPVHWISLLLDEDSIVLAHLFADICNERILDLAEPSVLSLGLEPSEVSKVGVSGHADDLCAEILELLNVL